MKETKELIALVAIIGFILVGGAVVYMSDKIVGIACQENCKQ